MRSSLLLASLLIVAAADGAPWFTTIVVGREQAVRQATPESLTARDPEAELKAAVERINPLAAEIDAVRQSQSKAASDAERAASDKSLVALLMRRATTCVELLRAERAFTGADPDEVARLAEVAARELSEQRQLERIAAEEGRTLFLTATAKSDLNEVRKLDPKNWDALTLLVELLVQGDDDEAAQEAADDLLALAGAEPDRKSAALVWRAKASTDNESAVEDCTAAIKLDNKNVEAFRLRGLLQTYAAPGKAERDLMMAMAIEPDHLPTRLLYASQLLDAQEVDRALAAYGNSIKLSPSAAVLYQNRSDLLRRLGRFDEALADANLVVALRPGQVMALLHRAAVRSESGDVVAALDDLALAEKIDSDFANTIFFKANLLAQQDRAGEAGDVAKRFLEERPRQNKRLWQLVSSFYLKAKQYDDSVAALNQLLGPGPTTDPEHARLLGARAGTQGFAGKYREALADFEVCLKLAPDDPTVLNGFAWMLATAHEDSVRNGKRAVALAEQAVKLTQRRDPHALSTLAAAHAELGDYARALEIVAEALQLADDDATRAACEKEQAAYTAKKPYRDRRYKSQSDAPAAPK